MFAIATHVKYKKKPDREIRFFNSPEKVTNQNRI